jgi:hypothetical protein
VAAHRLLLTPTADAAVNALRGKPAADWRRLESELEAQGCRAAGYRLLGADSNWSPYCCKHLHGKWRVITTFEPSIVWIIDVVEHDGPKLYEELATKLGISSVGQKREHKPGCCGETGWPSVGPTREQRHKPPAS